ncbi:tubulin/FtsZ family protein [Natrialba sp. SSL1]|uniref:tubulin/FtsZ family protein n=1 Tax=Natrialba sp. SSL1 TaxID=1869245 RepID=UPI0008F966FA|nr:tubulin/FtsZ family protein [Natrialba sp. SSL1]OIB55301.1 cell division protein FtsZ [Natrialba sp. SSL1]
MQLEVIGIGGAGCRIADAIHTTEPSEQPFLCDTFAFDTDTLSLEALESIPDEHRHRYGAEIENGLNGNLQRGETIGEEHVDELSRQLDGGTPSAADAFLVAVGLGGATGGGAAPALVANLQTLYDAPVYVLATLPADRERLPDGDPSVPNDDTRASGADADGATRPMAAQNAVRTLSRLDGLANAIFCFDTEPWLRTGEDLIDGRDRLNREIATRIGAFFGSTAQIADSAPNAETVVDANDVARILGDETALVSLGYGAQQVDADDSGPLLGIDLGIGPFSSADEVETSAAVSAVETAVGKAIQGKLTLECDRSNVDRALLIVGGPPTWLNQTAVADGRRRLESVTESTETLGGDAPRPGRDEVFALAVLAGIEPVARIEALRKASEAH